MKSETNARTQSAQAHAAQKPFIVTIDGPAGVGKSTIARRVAKELNVAYLDTGAMFRTVALHLSRQGALGTSPDFDPGLVKEETLERIFKECTFSLEGAGDATRLLCNGVLVGDEIRSEEAGMKAALAAKIPMVRERLKQVQQSLGANFSLVAEGRDMGTVIFPSAQCKLFLVADPRIRARRRMLQLGQMGLESDLEELVKQIQERDEQDRNRAIAPLMPADDAHTIDTSYLDADQVLDQVMQYVRDVCDPSFPTPPEYPMRRKDRALSREEALCILAKCEYGILSLNDPAGWPYAVPLSYVLMDDALYFHSAYEGRKITAMRASDRACFVVVGETEPVYVNDFSTYFESVMVFGRTELVEEEGEKRKSLMALAEKYLPEHMDKAEGDINHSYSRTAVYKISIQSLSGKAKRPKKR